MFKTNYRILQVKSIAECSKSSILLYFKPSLSYHLSLRSVLSIFECPFYTGFTLLYLPCCRISNKLTLTHLSYMDLPTVCQPRVTETSCMFTKLSGDHLCINPIRKIGLIHKWSTDLRKLKWSVQVNILLNNCKQNITSLSFLIGTTVPLTVCYMMDVLVAIGNKIANKADFQF